MKKLLAVIAGAVLILGGIVCVSLVKDKVASASAVVGNDYNATTTRAFDGTAMATLKVIKAGPGSLGSVIITGAGAGTMNFYDATTSNVNFRNPGNASSSILIASFPVSAATATYTIDANLNNGLLYEVIGTAPTSTITWR